MDSPMTKTAVEVITSVQRRRRWSREEKERIVSAALVPGVNASAVAREAGIHVSQLFRWRHELCARVPSAPGFSAVAIAAEQPARGAGREASSIIEVELAGGSRLRISGPVASATVAAAITALARGERRR